MDLFEFKEVLFRSRIMENKRSIITCIFLIVRIDIDIQNILTSVQFEKLMILSKLNNNDIIFAITDK